MSHEFGVVYPDPAAQADVLAAAQAWPLLTESLSDLTDLPDRRQLAIKTPLDQTSEVPKTPFVILLCASRCIPCGLLAHVVRPERSRCPCA
jgi:hypothetical protein